MKQYLHDRIKIIGLFLIFGVSILGVEWVYKEDLSSCIYALILCLFLFLCIGTYDFLKYRTHKKQMTLIDSESRTCIEHLPEALDSTEVQYQEILMNVSQLKEKALAEANLHTAELNDYYTIWVHQIKTPIAAMRLVLKNMQDGPERSMLNQELFKIEQYAEMVLHFLRIDSMSADFVFKEYDLADIVKTVLKKFVPSFAYNKLSLELNGFLQEPSETVDAAEGVASTKQKMTVVTDEKWTALVIEQLLSNAVKYTKQGTIAISITREVSDAESDSSWLCLQIIDTGIGIAKEDLPRIFERGFTGYNGRMDKKSTGIGLYLCKRVTEQLGQRLEITSVLSEGTKASLYIPL